MNITDRIISFQRIPANDLKPHPHCFRKHPEHQQTFLRQALDEIGWASALIARETDDGYQLLDGVLRKNIAAEAEVPVLLVNLTDDEAELFLATGDPIGEMAETDREQLDLLLSEIGAESAALNDYLSKLATDNGIMPPAFEPVSAEEQGRLDRKKEIVCPKCGHKFVP